MIRNLLAGLCICLFLTACEEPDLVSTSVIPGTDQPGVIFSDTSTVIAFSMEDDSLVSNNAVAPMFAGSLNDQELGLTKASFYIQLLQGTSLPSIASSVAIADSIFLSLAYKSNYGDTTCIHHVTVNRLGEPLVSGTTYHTTDSFELDSRNIPLIGSASLIPQLTDPDKTAQLRIPLSNEFKNELFYYMKNPSKYFDSNDTKVFLNYFRGLYISSNAEFTGSGDVKGSILAFEPGSSVNTVTVYYRDSLNDTTASSYSFQLGASSIRSNRIEHNHISSIFNDTMQTPALLYIQSLDGLKVKIKFPHIANFSKDQSVSVNKAQLVFTVKSGSYNVLSPVPGIDVVEEDGTITPDEVDGFVGGGYNDVTKKYTIDIAQQMQRILNGTKSNIIYLKADDRAINANRTILEGAGSVQLKLTYTIKNN